MERTAGALLGLACGDALGAPITFMDPILVRRRYGKISEMTGGGVWAPGEWTDETGLTLCVAEGILEDPADPVPATGRQLLTWARTTKDVGRTVSAALVNFRSHGDWPTAGRNTPQARAGRAAGNGSLMRTLPVPLAYADRQAILAHSARLSAMTHWDPQAEVCCAVYCLWIAELLTGAELADGWEAALAVARRAVAETGPTVHTPGPAPLPATFWGRLAKVRDKRYEDLQESGYAGYCVECLEAVAWCCLQADTLEAAVLDAVNLAGNADTLAALAGGAAGARWGVDAIPARWRDRLLDRERLLRVAEQLTRRRG